MDEIGNYPSEGAPFHIGATGKTGRNARIADDMAEGFGVCRFFENNMIIAGSVIIMIALAARVSMGEIRLVGEHNFLFFVLTHLHNFKSFFGESLSEGV